MKNLDCPVPTEHWLTAWTKICSATFLSWTLKWRKYFPEVCLTEGILCNGLSNTLSTEDCAWLFLSRTHQKNTSVKVCTMPGGFQLIPVHSRCQPLFTNDEVSLWYLLVSLLSFPNILEVESTWKWWSDKTCSPLLVHTANGFLYKKKQVYLRFWWCQCPFLQSSPRPTSFWRTSDLLEAWGHLGRLQAGCFGNLHLYLCRTVHVCTGVFKKQFYSLHTLKVMFTDIRIQFCSTGTKTLCRCPFQHSYISIRGPGAKDSTPKKDRCHGKCQDEYRIPAVYT